MGLKNFGIIFDNIDAVYNVGQTVSGCVNITVDSNKKFKEISISLKGEAVVIPWIGVKQKQKTNEIVFHHQTSTHFNFEKYFHQKIVLIGGGKDDQILEAGRDYVFQFNYELPSNIPSSFEGEFGHVRYSAKAVIDRPWKSNHEAIVPFYIICPVDLNISETKLADPIHSSNVKTFCCTSGSLSAKISLQAGGFVPGESLLVNTEIENNSRINISSIYIQFLQLIKYHASKKSKTFEIKICEKHLGSLSNNTNENWNQEVLSIPSIPPSDLKNYGIIDIDYCVRLKLIPSGAHKKFILDLPVIIGTIPLHQNAGNFNRLVYQPTHVPKGWNLKASANTFDAIPTLIGSL